MSIILERGWESGNSQVNDVDSGNEMINALTLGLTTGRTGSYGLRLRHPSATGTRDGWVRWAMSGSPSDCAVSVWVNNPSTSFDLSNATRFRLLLSTGEYIDIRWNGATHTYDAYVDNVLVDSGSVEVSNAGGHHLQISMEGADVGNITVLIDGHESINWSGDTQPGAAATVSYLYWYCVLGGQNYIVIDDLVAGNTATTLGDLRVSDKRPDADDATAQWSPSAGSDNYAMEDETPASDADYNEADTDGLIDQLELDALDITGYTCEAVQAWSRAKMTDGTGDSLDVGVYSGSTASVNRSALSTSWKYYYGDIEEVDPDDSGQWSQAKLDALLHRKVAAIS